MSRYKVLKLPALFTIEDEDEFLFFNDTYIESLKKIEPIFNRWGMYYDRKKNLAWVETRFGCWELGTGDRWSKEELFYANPEEHILPDKVIEAIKVLHNYGHLPDSLKRKWWLHRNAVELRNTIRSARKISYRL